MTEAPGLFEFGIGLLSWHIRGAVLLFFAGGLTWLFKKRSAALRHFCWLNPFAWMALKRLQENQEMACDDEVIRRSVEQPFRYAEELLCWAREGQVLGAELGIWGRRSGLERRLRALLDRSISRQPLLYRQALLGAVLTPLLLFLIGGLQFRQGEAAQIPPLTERSWARVLDDGEIQFRPGELIQIEGKGTLRGKSRNRRLSFPKSVQFRLADRPVQPGTSVTAGQSIQVTSSEGLRLWTIRPAENAPVYSKGERAGSARGTGVTFVFTPDKPAFYHLFFEEERIRIEGWTIR